MLIDAALPIRIGEVPAFQNLVVGLSKMPEAVHCLTAKTLSKCIDDRFMTMKAEILEKLKHTRFVCTTADVWSSRRRSFLGVTVHWLNKKFERESHAIACSRFKGTHDNASIAMHINNAHQAYGLNAENVVFTVTDNAANMVKAFKAFGYVVPATASVNSDDEDTGSEAEEVGDEHDSEVQIVSMDDATFADDDGDNITLPKHIRCATQTLNLIATTDIQNAIKQKTLTTDSFDKSYNTAMSRCSKLWSYLGRSTHKASEAFVETFGKLVRTPCATRWNSLFDALSDLTELDVVKLHDFTKEQNIPSLQASHIEFLKEFLACLRPIAITLDKLQGEKQIIMAELIPCILNAHFLLNQLRNSDEIRVCKGLLAVIIGSLETRFKHVFDWPTCKDASLPLVMATISSPMWKLRWIDDQWKKTTATQWLLDEIKIMEKSLNFLPAIESTVPDAESSANLQVAQYVCDANMQNT